MGLLLTRFMQDVTLKGGGSARAMQDENDLHEGGGAGGQTQAQDGKFLRASILPRFVIPGWHLCYLDAPRAQRGEVCEANSW